MSGYAAAARINRTRPRVVQRELITRSDRAREEVAPVAIIAPTAVDRPTDDPLAAIRERWSQLTFFLFDPDSWR